ncbi:MAG: glycosyltransferase [Acidimicrobiia bacterium]
MAGSTHADPLNRSRIGAVAPPRPRVLWLTKGLGRGGTERLLVGGALFLDRDRFDVEVAYLLPWKDAFVPELESQGIAVHCLGARRLADPRWVTRLRRLVRTGGFDIVHTHMPLPAVTARLMARHGVPVIVHTEHNLWPRYRWATRWANSLTYRRNRAVIAVSGAVADSIRRPRRRAATWPSVEIVHHGADLRAVRRGHRARAEARVRLQCPLDGLVVGTVGNFTRKKDQQTLLDAFAIVARAHPALRLVLVGSGPLESELRDAVHRLDLESSVNFAGSRDDVFELLPGFDVFVLSSRHEGLPISLLEALATGVPCVASAVGGIPEVMADGREGFLVQPGDPVALATALSRLLEAPALRASMGAAGIERTADFDLERAMQRTQQLYDDVLSAR